MAPGREEVGVARRWAFLGGPIGVVTAGLLEYGTPRDLGVLPMVAVGLIEETAKLVVPAAPPLVVRRPRPPADGLLVGAAAGAGFAALEAMGYAFVTLIRCLLASFAHLLAARRVPAASVS